MFSKGSPSSSRSSARIGDASASASASNLTSGLPLLLGEETDAEVATLVSEVGALNSEIGTLNSDANARDSTIASSVFTDDKGGVWRFYKQIIQVINAALVHRQHKQPVDKTY